MKLRSLFILIFAFFLISNALFSQDKKTIELKAQSSKIEVKKGETFTIRLTMTFYDDWYTYDMKDQINKDGIGPTTTEITVLPTDDIELTGKVITPTPKSKYDDGFEMNLKYFKGKNIAFDIPVKAKKDLNFSKDSVSVDTYLQLCNHTSCLPPKDYYTKVSDLKFEQAESEDSGGGIFSFLWLAMTAGALALLTPCVFPMVPITVSFFAKRSEVAKGKGLRDALVYAIGIIVTFTLLGFLFSILFGASGIQDFAKSPGVYLFIAIIFLIFTFNLFGSYEIQMPTGLMNKLNTKSQQGSGIGSVILMGLTFSLASFSCTGPLVGAALIAAAKGQWFYPIISMLGFSTVLAAPFFLLALFPSALGSMPKAGGWMNNMKVVLGFIVLATTLYFINNALVQWGSSGLSREMFLGIWITIFAMTTYYILGGFKTHIDTDVQHVGSTRILFALSFGTLTIYLFTGLLGSNLGDLETYIPQAEKPTTLASASIIQTTSVKPEEISGWLDNYDEALKVAKAENKSIFIDFSGKTCTNCKKMERTMFPKQRIKDLINKMVKLRLITDINKEPYISNKNFQINRFNSVAMPLYVILNSNGELIDKKDFTSDEDEFVAFLNKAFQ